MPPATTLLMLLCMSFCTVGLVACGQPAPPNVPPAPGGPFTASHECHSSSPDVVPFEAIPSTTGKGDAQYPSAELAVLNSFMEAHTEVYGGTYFRVDHAYVGFVRDAAQHLAELRALVPDRGYFVAYCAPFSVGLQRYVSSAIPVDPVLRTHGVRVLDSGLDLTSGGVEVRVAKIASDTDSLLHQRYGDIIGAVDEGELRVVAG